MSLKNKILPILQKPSLIALIILLIFIATTGYHYGWDDQHLEIPLLKSLIDHELYQGDYYVESLKKNFTSYFYIILSKLITVDQIPAVYFILFLVSRYFLFYWIYKLWLLLTKEIKTAFVCSLVFVLLVRVPEFLYRTFSHQEFALAIIFAGIYYFFKERFYLASLLLGIATNFHALYSLFPMFYMGIYLLLNVRREGLKKLFLSSSIFILTSLPFFIWAIRNRFSPPAYTIMPYPDWRSLFVLACPQNFMFPPYINTSNILKTFAIFFEFTKEYLLLIALFFINLCFNTVFRDNKKALAYCYGAFILLIFCFVFTFLHPVRLFLDLNLARNTQYLSFLLFGFTAILIVRKIEAENIIIAFLISIIFALFKYGPSVSVYSSALLFLILLFISWGKEAPRLKRTIILSATGAMCIALIIKIILIFHNASLKPKFIIILSSMLFLLSLTTFLYFFIKGGNKRKGMRKLLYIIPLVIFFFQFTDYFIERKKLEASPIGFWELQSSWEDMQRYVKDNTPKNSLLLVPYNMEMGGFRIQSERKIVASYRDCGIIGFDYSAAHEWVRRIHDIEPYKIAIKKPIKTALRTAIEKYKVNYIVFMRYADPGNNSQVLQRIYTNSDFVLYEVLSNPVPPLKKISQF